MEHQKILHLLNQANDSKFVTRKWNIVNDQSYGKFGEKNEIIYNTDVWKSNLCDYNDAYIIVRDDITIAGRNLATKITFKSCAPFTKCITKIDETTMDDAEDLDLAKLMYNLIEHSSNYSEKQEVYGFILKMKQLILMQTLLIPIILNLSCIRLNYEKTLKLMEIMES